MTAATTPVGERTVAIGPQTAAADGSVDPVARLVRVAVQTEDTARLLTAAEEELQRPLGLVGNAGEALAHAPDGEAGRRALAVARSAATTRLLQGRGWTVVRVGATSAPLGVLAIGPAPAAGAAESPLLEVLAELVAEQLKRAVLLRAHAATFVRRLICDPHLDPDRARGEAATLGLTLASAYWPALLAWRGPRPRFDVLEAIDRRAVQLAPGAMTATLDGRLVLLHPGDASAALQWFEAVVRLSRDLAASPPGQAIAADAPAALGDLSDEVARLVHLWRFGPRADDRQPVAWACQYALDGLLRDNVAGRDGQRFVRERLGPLIDWDRAHRTNLVGVLEAALDFPRHEAAASRCFMHRNTFRHHLRQATDVLGDDLSDPDVRLAVHVALKLRHVLGMQAAAGGAAGASRSGGRG
jgi:hypothetical protein